MAFKGFYKDTQIGDFISIGLWDYKTKPYFAEGGASSRRPSDPNADTGNNTGWGLNNQFREIADKIQSLNDNKSANGHTHTESDITDLDHNAQKIKNKIIDDSNIGDGKVLFYNQSTDKMEYKNVSSGGSSNLKIILPAGSWDYPNSNPAPLNEKTGTNGEIQYQAFDDTTEEFVITHFNLPDISSFSNAKFSIYGMPITWVTGKNISLRIYHSVVNDDENWDNPYISFDLPDLALNIVGQDYVDLFSTVKTIASLGWASYDIVRLKLSRIAPSVNNLVGDWGLVNFMLELS